MGATKTYLCSCTCPRAGHAYAENGVRFQHTLVRTAVQSDYKVVNRFQAFRQIEFFLYDCRSDDLFDIMHGFQNPTAAERAFVSVSELNGLIVAFRRPRRHYGDKLPI